MKLCPRCSTEHNKNGIYCSRQCANSRVFSDEANNIRSIKAKLRHAEGSLHTPESRAKASATIRAKRLASYTNTSFEDLGPVNRRRRVFEEQMQCCNKCGISTWRGVPITLELEHIDGNNQNNTRKNLEGLCPNCHSITPTWRGRNNKHKNIAKKTKVPDDVLLAAVHKAPNIRQALIDVGLTDKGRNYARVKRLLHKQ